MQNSSVNLRHEARRMSCAIIAAVIFAVNIKTFVRAGGLYPSGFNGVTLLVQQIGTQFFGIAIPFSLINLPLNAIPAFISFKYLGPKFTVSSCCVVVLTSLLTDFIPSQPITYDPLLISIFGGLINGLAASLCLIGNTSGGGTDFDRDFGFGEIVDGICWNYSLGGQRRAADSGRPAVRMGRGSLFHHFPVHLHTDYTNSSPEVQKTYPVHRDQTPCQGLRGNQKLHPSQRHTVHRKRLLQSG